MNRLRLLLVLSVALNIGFLTLLILTRASTPRSASATFSSDVAADSPPGELGATAAGAGTGRGQFTRPADYRRLAVRLRDMGMAEAQIRRLLRGAAWADWRDEIARLHLENVSAEEWRPRPMDAGIARRMNEAKREREAALAEVLGPDSLLDPWMLGHSPGLRNLAPAKRRAVILVEEDYQMLTSEIQMKAGGVLLPEDQEALRLLKQERDRDLASILSVDELDDYEVHSLSSARLRADLQFADLSKEELRAIVRLRRDFDNEFNSWSAEREQQELRLTAEQQLNEQLRKVLGEERFQEYQRGMDSDFQQLARLAQRLGLPRERAREVYELKRLIEHQYREIQQDQNLSREDREEAAQLLLAEAGSAISEAFGERGAKLYFDHGGWWLGRLQDPAR